MDVMVSALLATAPMLVMLTIFLIFTLRRAKKTKNAAHYISSGYCCSMILVVVMALLAQYILAFILMLVTTIVGVVMLPKMLQAASDVAVETVVPDTSGPLRLKDFFSWYFIPKLERI
jgi:hypothetical protein